MEDNSKTSICLMLATSVFSDIDYGCFFSDGDLFEKGIEREHHITVFYGVPKNPVDRNNIVPDIENVLGEKNWKIFSNFLQEEDKLFNLSDVFYLDKFEQPDCDYLILRLKDDKNEVFDTLRLLNKALTNKYGITLSFSHYKPHLTLAQLEKGMADKYLKDEGLKLWLEVSHVRFEDFVYSKGYDSSTDKWKEYNLTTYHAVDRYFKRKRDLKLWEDSMF